MRNLRLRNYPCGTVWLVSSPQLSTVWSNSLNGSQVMANHRWQPHFVSFEKPVYVQAYGKGTPAWLSITHYHLYFCAPFEKRWHIVLHLSVGRLVGRSVDQTISAKYLLTLSLESYQTRYRECPEVIDDTYRFWSHMVKAQGQTAGRCKNYVWSISLTLSARNLPNLVWMPLESRWPLLIFRSHGQRWRSNCWSLYK